MHEWCTIVDFISNQIKENIISDQSLPYWEKNKVTPYCPALFALISNKKNDFLKWISGHEEADDKAEQ